VHGGEYTYTQDYNDDGYITPDEYRAERGRFPDDRLVIEYEQEYTMPYLGIGCEGTWGFLNLRGHLLYSPWVSGEDHDYHALRNMHFDGDFEDGDWFGAGASASWFFLPRWYATLSVDYQKFDEIIGDVTVSGEELPQGPGVAADGGSVELETVMLLFGVGYRF
jgi:plasminogen activator